MEIRINLDQLMRRIQQLGAIGALEGGGCCRLALTDADKAGRDLVVGWMRELGLAIQVDQLGNVIGTRAGRRAELAPIMIGSHIDTVGTGGLYDGNYGVLAGLEVLSCLDAHGITLDYPLAVAFFTNEEGVRFQPDMMGSLVYAGGFPLEQAWAAKDTRGVVLRDELERIGYLGDLPPGHTVPAAYLELHIEQGPVLERKGLTIGCVEGVQGISWQELTLTGVSNHAGTTPMNLRQDAGYAAAAIATAARRMTQEMGGNQLATVGYTQLEPNLINVIARKAILSLDLRNTDELLLQEAERRTDAFVAEIAAAERVGVSKRMLVRLQPAVFPEAMVDLVERTARRLGFSNQRMSSGAGHDAGLMSAICPVGMIFVPSVGGISHNVNEYTAPSDLEAGANVLLHCVLELGKATVS